MGIRISSLVGLVSLSSNQGRGIRTFKTSVDTYFQKHQELPLPPYSHAVLSRHEITLEPILTPHPLDGSNEVFNKVNNGEKSKLFPPIHTFQQDRFGHKPSSNHEKQNDDEKHEEKVSSKSSKNILVIGDVHGCLEELKNLIHLSTEKHNHNQPFSCIIFVGDLCNKGPYNAEVIRYIRTFNEKHESSGKMFAVRGNHDDSSLKAACGDMNRRSKQTYQWTFDGSNEEEKGKKHDAFLSDKDVEWMSKLPYTITIPASYFDENKDEIYQDTVIVHAGLDQNVELWNQKITTMTTIRTTEPADENDSSSHSETSPVPWASVWEGPPRVIFGHDAKLGIQKYDKHMAIGLDSGAVYGNSLSGIVLPQTKIISVPSAKVYCPIKKIKKRNDE